MSHQTEFLHLCVQLENVLQQQMLLVQKGEIGCAEFECLEQKADGLVKIIAKADLLGMLEFESQKQRLQKLYEGLCLAIAEQNLNISNDLKQVSQAQHSIARYRENSSAGIL